MQTRTARNVLYTRPSALTSMGVVGLLVHVFSVLSSGTTLPTTPSLAQPCAFEHTAEGLKADCAGKGLTEVPANLPSDVTSLVLNANKISILENTSFIGLPILKVLSLTSSRVTDIQGGAFHQLPQLQSISLNRNELSALPKDLFSKNTNLQVIQLSVNNFTSVPVHAFATFESLNSLILNENTGIRQLNFAGFPPINASEFEFASNSISDITTEDLSGLADSHIDSISLAHNNLANLAIGVFQNLKFVKRLALSFNLLENLTLDSFLGMEHLETLYIETSKVKRIQGFTNNSMNERLLIPPLKNLTLSYNKLYSWQSGVFVGLELLLVMNLRECHIQMLSTDTFKGLNSLSTIDLTGNLIELITQETFLHLTRLDKLILTRNKIKTLSPSSFSGLSTLKFLDLSRNSINAFEASTWNTSSLTSLDLSDNKIESLGISSLQGLDSLSELILSANPIITLKGGDAFAGLKNLTTINLSHLGLFRDLSTPFKALSSLLSLDLSHTPLGSIRKSFQGLISLEHLDLGYTTITNNKLYKDNISAFSFTPNLKVLSLRGNILNYMYPDTFQGLHLLISMDISSCGITALHPDIFQNLYSLTELHLDRNNIYSLTANHLRDLHSLQGLRIQTNQLKSIEKNLFSNNKNLYFVAMSDNALAGVEKNTFFPMKILDLSGNPLSCTCDLQWFREFVETSRIMFNNLDKTICSSKSLAEFVGKALYDFMPDQACGPDIVIYVSAMLIIVLFMTGSILAYWNRWWLNYKCFHIKLLVVGYYELEDGREHLDYPYDIFVIFPDDDEIWAKNEFLGAVQENFPEFPRERIIFGEEDLPLGGMRINAIDYVIENSFKTLLIVSNAAVHDAHFMMKFQMAVEHMNEVQLEKVLIVFREDVPDNQLPYLVRLFLSKNKPYFKWTDNKYNQKLFWRKLTKVMRKNKKMNNLLPI